MIFEIELDSVNLIILPYVDQFSFRIIVYLIL